MNDRARVILVGTSKKSLIFLVKIIATMLTGLIFFACQFKTPVMEKSRQEINKENEKIFLAYDAFNHKSYAKAYKLFNQLYTETQYFDFFEYQLKALFNSKRFALVEAKSRFFLSTEENKNIRHFLAIALIRQKKYQEALKVALKLLGKNNTEHNYILIADIYSLLGDYKESLKFYESAYNLSKSEVALIKIANILKIQKNYKEAIARYETHIRLQGCGTMSCSYLADLYLQIKNFTGVITTLQKLYKETKDRVTAAKIVDLYKIKKDYYGLANFLSYSNFDNKLLIEVYKYLKKFEKAKGLALRIYHENKDLRYLAEYAMLKFETTKKMNQKVLLEVISDLKRVVQQIDDHVYFNYLGYLLVDNDLDLEYGLQLIKQALEQESDNIAYLDSLAWAYYKLENYESAYKVMQTIAKMKVLNGVIKQHYEIIENAYKHAIKQHTQ